MIEQRDQGTPRIVKFTRRDTHFPPLVTNQKITAVGVECSTTQDGLDFLNCIFEDELGSKKSVANIIFTNFEVKNPLITSYKDSQTARLVQQVAFSHPTVCEIMGQNRYGLTMKCSDFSNGKRE